MNIGHPFHINLNTTFRYIKIKHRSIKFQTIFYLESEVLIGTIMNNILEINGRRNWCGAKK